MKIIRLLSPFVLVLFAAVKADADPFTILPNGDLVFNVGLTTQGSFSCGTAVACTGSGNSITLLSGGGSATFGFTGVNTTFAVGNRTIPVTLGTFQGSSTSGFSVPTSLNPYVPLAFFDLNLSHSSPVVASVGLEWAFGPSFTRFGEASRTYLALPVGAQPSAYHYSSIVYTLRVIPLTLPLNGSTDLLADVGAVPEPASFVLLGTGLAALYSRRRKRTALP